MTSRSGLQSRHFNPRSPRGGSDATICRAISASLDFNPRSPRGGATGGQNEGQATRTISIHAPHEGERRPGRMSPACGCGYFNPRSPRGGATRVAIIRCFLRFISIHAPHEGERPFPLYRAAAIRTISIHAPHEGERPTRPETADGNICISIHAPHEGERPGRRRRKSCSPSYFNPRSPRGGATHRRAFSSIALRISIHAPHEGERRVHGDYRYSA